MTPLYVDAKFDSESENLLYQIVNSIGATKDFVDRFHCTIVYSRSPIPRPTLHDGTTPDDNMTATTEVFGEFATITGFGHFDTEDGKNLHVLVSSQFLLDEHNRFMDMGASFDYDEYTPHVTLMYDCGNFDVNSGNSILNRFIGRQLKISQESMSPLDENWVDNSKNK